MCCPSSRSITVFFSLLGLCLSLYALHVETEASKDPNYKALCDISSLQMSCSKVFASKYGRGFGLVSLLLPEEHPINQPNSVYGIFFYSLVLLLAFINVRFIARVQVLLSFISVLGSLYLGYILYFILEELCPVCIATYLVNFILLISSFCKLRNLKADQGVRGYHSQRRVQSPKDGLAFKKYI